MSVVHDLSRMEFENIVLHIEVNPILFFFNPSNSWCLLCYDIFAQACTQIKIVILMKPRE